MKILFDIETDGLYWDATKVHCLCLKILGDESNEVRCYTNTPVGDGGESGSLEDGLKLLASAEELIGHNIIGYDLPVLKKLCGFGFTGKKFDTLLAVKLLFPTIDTRDMIMVRSHRFPAKLIGRQSLKAWGFRLGIHKGSFCEETDWKDYSAEMRDYCKQDVNVNHSLYNYCMKHEISQDAFDLETRVAEIITQQTIDGWTFDLQKARELHLKWLEERDRMDAEVSKTIPPFINRETFIPRVNNATRGYVKGQPFERVIEIPFNPNSRQHIIRFFREKYGWSPSEVTETGQPKIDETVLSSLPFPEAKALAERFELQKHIGMLAEGNKAWLKLYNPQTGRIHGTVDTLGTRTRRCAHRDPNLAQVPAHSKYGKDCRSLFCAPEGYLEIGVDAAALELRCLAHYMAAYDGGEYIDVVLNGDKADGTDMHSRNAKALGLSRDDAKTWFYAFIYGAGDEKLGTVGSDASITPARAKKLGTERRAAFMKSLPALEKITRRAQQLTKERGWLYSLDHQRLVSPSQHAALNTLLQSAGSIIVKRALVIANDKMKTAGLPIWQVGFIHDELAFIVPENLVDSYPQLLLDAFVEAGEYYKFRCPIEGEVKIGRNWSECH